MVLSSTNHYGFQGLIGIVEILSPEQPQQLQLSFSFPTTRIAWSFCCRREDVTSGEFVRYSPNQMDSMMRLKEECGKYGFRMGCWKSFNKDSIENRRFEIKAALIGHFSLVVDSFSLAWNDRELATWQWCDWSTLPRLCVCS